VLQRWLPYIHSLEPEAEASTFFVVFSFFLVVVCCLLVTVAMASIIYCLLHCDWTSKCKTMTSHHSSIVSKLFSLTTAVICNCIYIATIASNKLANLIHGD